jgi:hypothetical protein
MLLLGGLPMGGPWFCALASRRVCPFWGNASVR